MTGELSGVDLARRALVAAREAAKKNASTTRKPKRRTTTLVSRDGREPLGAGSAISRMPTERGMVVPAAAGSVLAQFDAILGAAVPELAGRVEAAGFDADTGRRMPPEGYRRVLEAHREAVVPSRGDRSGDRGGGGAADRRDAGVVPPRVPRSRRRRGRCAGPDRAARTERRRQAGVSHTAALRRAPTERAAREAGTVAALTPQRAPVRASA